MKAMRFPISVFVGALISWPVPATHAVVLNSPGEASSPGKGCLAVLTTSPMGGFLELAMKPKGGKSSKTVRDVSGFAWVGSDRFVFSVSPIYGKPGIFSGVCNTRELKTHVVVKPSNITAGYPNGTDYFELVSVDGAEIKYRYGKS